MRIGIFTDTYLPDINGVVTSIVQEKNQLEAKGHEVFIVTSTGGSMFKSVMEDNVIRVQGIKMPKKLYNYRMSPAYSIGVARKLKKLRLDVIHVHSEFGVAMFGRIFAKLQKIPLVYTYHTLYEDYSHYVGSSVIGGSIDQNTVVQMITKLSKVLCEKCDEVVAPTQKTRNIIRMYGVEKYINIIPTGIDLSKFDPSAWDISDVKKLRYSFSEKGDRVLMFVGRIAQEKNIDIIIDAISQIKNNLPKFKFIIVGDGPHAQYLKNKIDTLQLNDFVKMLGKVENANIGLYYQTADAFISASTSETQGLTFIEAMASKLPVMGIDDAAARQVVDDNENGWIFSDIVQLKEKLIEFSEMEKDDLLVMSAKALISSEKYSASIFGDKIEEVLQRAVSMYNK